jgi:hypothetical protein
VFGILARWTTESSSRRLSVVIETFKGIKT